MRVNIYRNKLLNATLFFASKTKHLNVTKLAKLLYFLDFDHFKQTGYPAIGLKYYAFKWGPVPREFWLEVKDGKVPEDFKGKLGIVPVVDKLDPMSTKGFEFRAVSKPDLSIFTPREKKILSRLADIYRDAKAGQISEVSHMPRQPWDITFKKSGENCPIDYLLAIDDKSEISIEEARDSLTEHFEIVRNLSIEPTK
jgi:uncharacterized phage-associated protein